MTPFAAALLIALLPSPAVAVHLDEIEDVAATDALECVDAFAHAIERATGRRARIDDPAWASPCATAAACAEEIRGRTQASDVVILRLYGGPRKIHAVAELAAGTSTAAKTREANVERVRETWPAAFDALAGELFGRTVLPQVRPAERAVLQKAEPARSWVLPSILVGAAVGLGTGGALFGLDAKSARDRIEGGALTAPVAEDAASRLHRDQLVANLCFGGALVALIGAVIVIVFERE